MSDHDLAAARAAAEWGFPEPNLVRRGMNSLYLAGDDVVLRVAPVRLPEARAAETDFLARMSRLDLRVPRQVRGTLEAGGIEVIAMERVVAEGEIDWREVGAMIRRVHSLDPAEVPGLPWCGDFPHWQIDVVLADVRDEIDAPARSGLTEAIERWRGWQERARPVAVVCHGDVHPGNVIPTREGPVLLDWDLRCLGPAAWDHGPVMAWPRRWGGEPRMYADFADGYGVSLEGDWLGECMAELRNVVATLMRVRAARSDPSAAVEANRRLRFWRADPDAPQWMAQ